MNKTRKRSFTTLLFALVSLLALVLSLGILCACGSDESANIEDENANWYYGNEVPAAALGKNGDYYLNTETLTAYAKTADGTWLPTVLHKGDGEPNPSDGETGDLYLDTKGGVLYEKGGSDWGIVLTLKGPPGRDGVMWFSGAKDPEAGDPALQDAAVGDFYLNTEEFTVWQFIEKEDETHAWDSLGSIVGKGVQGLEAKGNRLTVTFTDGTEESFTLASCLGEHTFGEAEPMTIIEVGCTTPGLVIKTCTVCGMNVVESVEATGHQFVDGVCTACGKSQLEGHYETNEEGQCEVTISPDLVEEGGDLTIASTVEGEEVTVKESISEELVEAQNYDFRQWLRNVSDAKKNPNVNLHIGTLVIQDGVNVGPGAFAGATIEHLVLEGNASYGAYAFDSVKGLQDVTIKGKTTLGTTIFDNVPSLVSVDMSEATITEIPVNAFYGCKNLSEVTLPEAGLETIEISAFDHCSSLQHITLPEGLKTIKECAFSEADIREIVFPKSLSEIQIYVFQLNENLSKAVFQTKIEKDTFGNNKSKTQWNPHLIFARCGSRENPLQICFTGSKDEWSEFEKVTDLPSSRQVVYDYDLNGG